MKGIIKIAKAVAEHLGGGDPELREKGDYYYGDAQTSDYWLRRNLRGTVAELLRKNSMISKEESGYHRGVKQFIDLKDCEDFGRYLISTSQYSSSMGYAYGGRGRIITKVESEKNVVKGILLGNYSVVEEDFQANRRYVGNFFRKEKAQEFAYKRARRLAEILARNSGLPLTDNVAGRSDLG